jgi:hypothetical protein
MPGSPLTSINIARESGFVNEVRLVVKRAGPEDRLGRIQRSTLRSHSLEKQKRSEACVISVGIMGRLAEVMGI